MFSYEEADISEIIKRCRERDDLAFAELVRRYTPMMRKVASGFVDGSFEFDELFSEACVALHNAAGSFDVTQGEVTFGLYARTCVYNRLVDFVRSANRRLGVVDVDLDKVGAVSSPESLLVRREQFELLLKSAAALLSDYEYRVLMLHIQGYKTSHIAEVLGKSAKSIDNAKSRLFSRLRGALSDSLDN